MGDWDFYCALCAASFTTSGIEDVLTVLNLDNSYQNLFSWARTLQVVGQNPQASGLSCCYISGNGHCDYYGTAICRPSAEPNCPVPNGGSETFDVSTYYNYAAWQEEAIPVHEKCLQIFKRVLAYEKGVPFSQLDEVDLDSDVFFSAMREKRQSKELRCLDLDYFELDKYKREQFFIFEVLTSPFLSDPLHIPAMKDYINALPIAKRDPTKAVAPRSHSFSDPLSRLPPEIIIEILIIMPIESFTTFMTTSPAARHVQLASSFWKKRVEIHIPWSWEVFAHAAQKEQSYDWEKIYNDLEKFSKSDTITFESIPLGFANRRRIYNVCRQLTPIYIRLENEAQATSPTDDSKEMLRNAKCQHFVGVSIPLSSTFSSTNTFMLSQWSDIANERKTMEISWNSSGVLAGISLTIRGIRSAVGSSEIGAIVGLATDTIVIQEGDWIEGFLFFMSAPDPKITGVTVRTLRAPYASFGSTNGVGLRLMSVDEGNVFVGLKAAATTDSISRLGILECTLPPNVDLPLLPPRVNAATRKLIWKKQLPPPSVRALPFLAGYNNYGNEATEGGQFMEPLIFGVSEAQLSALTGIAVSADFLGMFAYHNNTEPSFIGLSKNNLKYFSIDGPGGERITKLSLGVGSTPVGVKVLTNRGRQGIFGMFREGSCQTHDYTGTMLNEAIAGIYGSFENLRNYPRFTAFGILYAPSTTSQSLTTDAPPGDWDPTPPPTQWYIEEPIYGGSEHFALTYLDLTKPVSKISGLFAAPDWCDIVELGGFVVTYTDGTTSYVGNPTDQWAEVHDAESALNLNRHQGMSYGFGKADEAVVAHATTAEAVGQNRDSACWDLGLNGAYISAVTAWAGKYLNGIQFHAVDGRASPKWGKCGQSAAAFITTHSTTATRESTIAVHVRAVGVKFFLDSQRDHYNASDARPVGLQALVANT
ncbi:hypothetical protein J3R30DRAFT_3482020 [Lentinula aciculospora]|uniref:F-box domain-containing protein n=1 Tax=Lentinula aciculospora TaxID=153920 RepID=A0A9W9DNS4_9AGAR|nr:hypothetical protein J3R30DRAFT_3482020 [Lentinula aciculospora]